MSQENVEIVRAVYASIGRGIDEELWDRVPSDFVADWSRAVPRSAPMSRMSGRFEMADLSHSSTSAKIGRRP